MSHAVRVHYPEAPTGTVAIYKRGSTTELAEVFADPECETPTTSYTLNAYGRFTGYVLEEVDVRVRDVNAAFVDGWTEGVGAPLVEVRDNNFTGTLTDGSQGLGGRVELVEVLDRYADSFGSTDGYVKETGTSTALKLKDALHSVRSTNAVFIVVTDPTYGAIGDGATDDRPAIQKALDAAAAAPGGGIVYFPPTNNFYLLTGGLTLSSHKVSLMGASALGSTLKITTTNIVLLTINAGSAVWGGAFVRNLGFDCVVGGGAQTNCIEVVTAPGYTIDQLRIRGFRDGISVQSRTVIQDCDYFGADVTGAVKNYGVKITGAGSIVRGGRYETGLNAFGGIGGSRPVRVEAADVLIDGAMLVNDYDGGTGAGVEVTTGPASVVNCEFKATTGKTHQPNDIVVTADIDFMEDNNRNGDAAAIGTPICAVSQTTRTWARMYFGSRKRSRQTTTVAAAGTANISAVLGDYLVNVTGTPVTVAVAVTTGNHARGLFSYTVRNTTGGVVNVTNSAAGSGTHIGGAVIALNAAKTYTIVLRYNEVTDAWDEVSFATG